jgi:hypothetical protein
MKIKFPPLVDGIFMISVNSFLSFDMHMQFFMTTFKFGFWFNLKRFDSCVEKNQPLDHQDNFEVKLNCTMADFM